MASFTLEVVAKHINADTDGDGNLQLNGIAAIDQAAKGQLTFVAQSKYLPLLADCKATAVIVSPKLEFDAPEVSILYHPNPYLAYAKAAQLFYPERPNHPGNHPSAVVGVNTNVGADVEVGANAVVGEHCVLADGVRIGAGCVIGDNVTLHESACLMANVTLYDGVNIGARTRVHSGAVIGADGFGYAPDNGRWEKIPQVGSVRIGADVEIGANVTIDRGALQDTIVGDGVILDNLVQLGHNVVIQDYTAIAGSVAVAGSTVIGKRCQIGGASAITGHITIADDTVITGMSMVTNSIKKAGVYSSGLPATENRAWRKNVVRVTQLDKMARQFKVMRAELDAYLGK